jgi:uncharacterized protein DUF4231
VLASISAFFHWRESWIRRSETAEALKSEKAKYETRTSSNYAVTLSDQQALENFVLKIEFITSNEVSQWRALALASQNDAQAVLDRRLSESSGQGPGNGSSVAAVGIEQSRTEQETRTE